MDKTAWFVVTCCLLLMGLNFWYGSQNTAPAPQPPAAAVAPADPADPTAAAGTDPTAPAAAPATAPTPQQPAEVATLTSHDAEGNPVVIFHFQDIGGSLSSAQMVGKPINSTKADLLDDVRLNSRAAHGIGSLMFGLSSDSAPSFDSTVYHLVPEESDASRVTLEGQMHFLTIRKVYSLIPIRQGESSPIPGHAYCLHLSISIRNNAPDARQARNWGIYTGTAGPISSGEWSQYTYYIRVEDGSFRKENPGSFKPFFGEKKQRIYTTDADKIAWAGVMNQYYATLVHPVSGNEVHSFYAAPVPSLSVPGRAADDPAEGVELALGVPDFTMAAAADGHAGGSHTLEYTIFSGPKLNLMLNAMTSSFPKIDHIMDYGVFHIISYSMNWLINIFYRWFGNWGWAIVAMTFVVRLLIWPLYRKSYMSMKSMSLLQPKMQELREKYPNDQQKVSMEMMKLYREYGISPFGGCLPMFLQIPIFFSFFYVLQTAAEFRGAPFIGWITDLSQMDTVATLPILGYQLPINVLPIIMALSMFIQMRMSPQAGDPAQQRILRLMPLFFFAFCYTYPSALALYWTTTNIISIIQTQLIRRLPQPELKKVPRRGPNAKKGFFERMAEAQQAALAEQQRRRGSLK